jgi:hypothetical protein
MKNDYPVVVIQGDGRVRHEALIDREVVKNRLPRAVAADREKLGAARSEERR